MCFLLQHESIVANIIIMGLIVIYVTDCFTKGHVIGMGAYSLDKLDFCQQHVVSCGFCFVHACTLVMHLPASLARSVKPDFVPCVNFFCCLLFVNHEVAVFCKCSCMYLC